MAHGIILLQHPAEGLGETGSEILPSGSVSGLQRPEVGEPYDRKLKGVVKSVLFKGVHYETMVETKVGTEITVKMMVRGIEMNRGSTVWA